MRTIEQLKADLAAAIDNRRDEIIAIGRQVWKNPEAGYHEFKTAKLAEETLRKLGLSPKTGYSLTGLRADLKGAKPGPVVGLLGEMDALIMPSHPEADPANGCAHACGHHSHITALLGAAMALTDAKAAQELAGTIAFIGCPAEECIELDYRGQLLKEGKIKALGGKASLIFDGVFDDVDMAFMHHAGHGFGTADHNGFCMKSATFHGVASHAAYPAGSQNALSAATLALSALGMLREKFCNEPTVRMHGILTQGGDSVNIIPDTATIEYQLRSFNMDVVEKLSKAFDNAVNGCAMAMGCTAEITSFAGYYPLRNNPDLAKIYEDTVHELVPGSQATPSKIGFSYGSTDVGDLSAIMPSLHGTCPGSAGGGHTVNFKTEDEEQAYILNTKLLVFMAVDLLYGNADKARAIATQKANCLTVEQYKQAMSQYNYVR